MCVARGKTSLVVQWLKLHVPNVGDLGLMQVGVHMQQLKISCATTKTQHNQNKQFLMNNKDKETVSFRDQH